MAARGARGSSGFSLNAGHLVTISPPLLDAHAVAEVVAEHDVEARHHHARQELVERAEGALLAAREQEAVVDVAVEEELVGGVALVEADQLRGPVGKCAHSICLEGVYVVSSSMFESRCDVSSMFAEMAVGPPRRLASSSATSNCVSMRARSASISASEVCAVLRCCRGARGAVAGSPPCEARNGRRWARRRARARARRSVSADRARRTRGR